MRPSFLKKVREWGELRALLNGNGDDFVSTGMDPVGRSTVIPEAVVSGRVGNPSVSLSKPSMTWPVVAASNAALLLYTMVDALAAADAAQKTARIAPMKTLVPYELRSLLMLSPSQ